MLKLILYLCKKIRDYGQRLANRVKNICAEKGLQLKELSSIMNVKPESLSRALNGNPQLSTLQNIAEALNVGIADLFSDRTENCIISSSTTPNSLHSIIVYKEKTYIADNLNALLDQVRLICDDT